MARTITGARFREPGLVSKTRVSANRQGQPGVKEYFQMREFRIASVVVFHGRKNVARDHSNLSASSEYRKYSPLNHNAQRVLSPSSCQSIHRRKSIAQSIHRKTEFDC